MDQGNLRRSEAVAGEFMICLDTNYLIRALIPATPEARAIEGWLRSGELLMIPSVVWYEFLCGSTDEEEQLALTILDGRIIPFDEAEARISAASFRVMKKPRRLRVDAMIAGTAIVACAKLATANTEDFVPFVAHGLKLI